MNDAQLQKIADLQRELINTLQHRRFAIIRRVSTPKHDARIAALRQQLRDIKPTADTFDTWDKP